MAGVPNIFGNATTTLPLSQLDQNFATNVTIGTTQVGLGNTANGLAGLSNIQIGAGDVINTLVSGTFTPTDASGASLAFTTLRAAYMQIGTRVWAELSLIYPATANTSAAAITLGALPACEAQPQGLFFVYYGGAVFAGGVLNQGTNVMQFLTSTGASINNATFSTDTIRCQFFYSTT